MFLATYKQVTIYNLNFVNHAIQIFYSLTEILFHREVSQYDRWFNQLSSSVNLLFIVSISLGNINLGLFPLPVNKNFFL